MRIYPEDIFLIILYALVLCGTIVSLMYFSRKKEFKLGFWINLATFIALLFFLLLNISGLYWIAY